MAKPAKSAYVALLRGINVGGKNMLPMKDLLAMFVAAGGEQPRHYIQSGNIVFVASPAVAKGVGELVKAKIAKQFGFAVPVVLRSAEELAQVAKRNPFAAGDVEILHVAFLSEAPKKAVKLDYERSPPDEFKLLGNEIYLRCPNGLGRSKLTNSYFDSALGTTTTLRNWRTLMKLIEMSKELAEL